MSLFGCASDEQFLQELEDIECRCDDLSEVRIQTEKLFNSSYDDDFDYFSRWYENADIS